MSWLSQLLGETWAQAAVWFSAVFATLAFIRKVSKDADKDLNPERREALAHELSLLRVRDLSAWVPDFVSVFDRFFGERHFSLRCFSRSIIISVLAFVALLFSYAKSDFFSAHEDFLTYLGAAILINGIADYFSLLETRFVLGMRLSVGKKIALDSFLTILIFFAWLPAGYFLLTVVTGRYAPHDDLFWSNYPLVMAFLFQSIFGSTDSFVGSKTAVFQSFFITTFTTSIWLWLHGLSHTTIKAMRGTRTLIGWLNVKETPLRAIGVVINAYILGFGLALFPVFILLRH